MRARHISILAVAAIALTACGDSGSSDSGGGTGSGGTASGDACAPVPGDQLVPLEDDKGLQPAENVIPTANAAYASANPTALDALDTVSAVLTTEDLIGLNSAVDNERRSVADVAAEYVTENDLGSGVTGSGAVTVGAASFTESQILAAVYAGALNAAGFTATVQTVGAREGYLPALQRGEFQLFPEYVGTLTEYLEGNPDTAVATADLQATLVELTTLGQAAGLSFGTPADAVDANAFAITTTLQDALGGITTLSELAEACSDGSLVLGGTPECETRPLCQVGLEQTYGLSFASVESLELGPNINNAVKQGVVSLGLSNSTDPAFAQ
ncbi:glycine betaine ABC transporter substrate-binding protein [Goekera deserti]|nr:glycine betaine ABC transporter substrate-binding protein [Goekera deserti]